LVLALGFEQLFWSGGALRQLFGVRVEISGCDVLLRDMFSVKRFGVLLHSSGFTCSSLDCAGAERSLILAQFRFECVVQ